MGLVICFIGRFVLTIAIYDMLNNYFLNFTEICDINDTNIIQILKLCSNKTNVIIILTRYNNSDKVTSVEQIHIRKVISTIEIIEEIE
jgi:anaerobic C4-dicarboxylate transporter